MAIAIVEMDSNEEQQHAATNMPMPPSRHTPPNNQPKQQHNNSGSRSSSESEQSSASKLFADPAGPSPIRQVTVTAEQASSRQQQNSSSLTANELWRMHQEQQRREENNALLQLLRQQQRQNDMLGGGGGNPMMRSGTSSSSTGMRNDFAATTQHQQQSFMNSNNNNNFDMNPISIRRMGMDNSRLTMPEGSYLMNNRNRSDMMNNSNSSNLGSGMGINNSMDRSSSLMNNRSTMDMNTSLRYMELLNNIMPTPMSAMGVRPSSAGMGNTTRTSSNFDTQLMNDNFMSSSFGNGSTGRVGGMPSSSNNFGSSSAADHTSFNSEFLLQQQLLNNDPAYIKASGSSGMGGGGMSSNINLGLGPSSMASSSLLLQQQQLLNNNDPLYGKVTAPPKMYPQEDQGWEDQFRALQHYQMQFGHCRVPARFKAHPKLGRWVMTQRRQFTLLMQGFPSALTAERIRRLEALGFTWSVRPEPVTTWNSKFQELKAYKATFGNVMVPQRYQANPQLGTWVHTQRRQYKLLMEGKKSSMTKEKAKALESLGFFWTATKTNAQKLQLPAKSDFKLELDASAGLDSDSDESDSSDLLKKPAAKF